MSDLLPKDSIFLVWQGEYEQAGVAAAYTALELAEAHVARAGGEVEEIALRDGAPSWQPYFHAVAQVGESDPSVDIAPSVEHAGQTDTQIEDHRVSTCPGSELCGESQAAPSIWLSVFGMDEDATLGLCEMKFDELRARRTAQGTLPSWSGLISEEHRDDG